MTATPVRTDGKPLGDLYTEIILYMCTNVMAMAEHADYIYIYIYIHVYIYIYTCTYVCIVLLMFIHMIARSYLKHQ